MTFEAQRRDLAAYRRVNGIYNWVAKTLGIAFVDPSSWIKDGAFGRDELRLNRRGAGRLGHVYCRMCNLGGERCTWGNK